MPKKPEYGGPWRRIRKQILERDQHTCQIQTKGCTTLATQVDHIIPTSQGGPWWDPTNLRASCPNCNNQRIDRTGQNRWQHNPNTRITLIQGPPASGKTTHIEEHAKPTDLIIDYNHLQQAISNNPPHNRHHHDATTIARNALLKALRQGHLPHPHVWITTTHPNPQHLPHHHKIQIDPGLDTCIQRSIDRGDPPHIQEIIHNYYRDLPHPTDQPTTANTSREW